ncbi:hypothetical protein DAI22_07g224200 [Oryza sativa Japonica Group]|nr:hypothetical protein DAI22_07g224200 [Oryza sativa Japonica Group]
MASQPLRLVRPSPLAGRHAAACKCSAAIPLVFGRQRLPLLVAFPRGSGSGSGSGASCSAVQESSSAAAATTVSEKKDAADAKKEATAEAKPTAKPAAKPKKPPVKPLPEMMQEEIIPPLKAALEAEDDVSQVELSFEDNRLEGSFIKDEVPYYFWAFFPNGDLTGPKGFALSSYGTEVSTIEPFLIDEKRANAKYVVFWVYKRLAGQGILPVWKEEEGEGEGEGESSA